MTTQLVALGYVLIIALAVMWIARISLTTLIPKPDMERMTLLFAIVSACAFLLPSFWLYAAALILILITQTQTTPRPDDNLNAWRATLWFWLLMAVPAIPVTLPGFAGINQFLSISHLRLLCWVLLIPIVLSADNSTRTTNAAKPWHPLDLCVLIYFTGLSSILILFYDVSFTVWLRQLTEWFTDQILPYLAMRRAFSTPTQIKRALTGFALVGMILAGLSVIEFWKHWVLYQAVSTAWGEQWNLSIYLERDGFLRAQASTGHSLVFGYSMACCLAMWLWLYRFPSNRKIAWLGTLALIIGIGTALSRATWMTIALMLVILAFLNGKMRNALLLGAGSVGIFLVLASFIPSFQDLLDKLPIIGNPGAPDAEKEYRQRLLEISLDLIAQSPWFGVPNALDYMEEMRQGQGIIDIVNSYIGVALSYGLVGLIPFISIFTMSIWRMWQLRQRLPKGHEGWHLANCMIALTITIMILIFSTSSISTIPFIYFALIGLTLSIERAYRNPEGISTPTQAVVRHPNLWTAAS
jgi:O-antigen ligase